MFAGSKDQRKSMENLLKTRTITLAMTPQWQQQRQNLKHKEKNCTFTIIATLKLFFKMSINNDDIKKWEF